MDDNCMSEGDNKKEQSDDDKECASPRLGGKKLKMNDGSSHSSFITDLENEDQEKDENVDSGVSADKSESTSSDDRPADSVSTQEGPSNVLIDAGPSNSNIRTILLNITPTGRTRNYRRRILSPTDSDVNDSSRDSDDVSEHEPSVPMSSDDNQDENFSHPLFSGMSDSNTSDYEYSSDDASSGNEVFINQFDRYMSRNDSSMDSDDDDDEDAEDNDNDDQDDDQEEAETVPTVLKKTKPPHNWFALREIIHREMGLGYPFGNARKSDTCFQRKFYGSLHAVYKMWRLHKLNKHKGCVNSINFHPEGHLLASGSDDTNVIVWDWARNVALQTIKTGHKSNVFQSKFLYLNAGSQLNIVTCARDGQVRLLQCPSGGGTPTKRKVASHSRAAHKLHVSPEEPQIVVSVGEDGVLLRADLRTDKASEIVVVKEGNTVVPLYTVHGHPLRNERLAVGGRGRHIRVYDTRHAKKPLALYCPNPDYFPKSGWKIRNHLMHLTCAVYNHDGSELLGSYNDEDIYLFNAETDVQNESSDNLGYVHRYAGHRNSATFKGVAFFGPNSEYIVSGSDCSYIYIWEKKSEAIVQWMHGDRGGVVNCIESHPSFPILATSGLDKNVKIWMPIAENPDFKGMRRIVSENSKRDLRNPLFNDFLPSLYSAWRAERSDRSEPDEAPRRPLDFDGNVCTTF